VFGAVRGGFERERFHPAHQHGVRRRERRRRARPAATAAATTQRRERFRCLAARGRHHYSRHRCRVRLQAQLLLLLLLLAVLLGGRSAGGDSERSLEGFDFLGERGGSGLGGARALKGRRRLCR
jgi:hypothetical protein